MPLKEDCKEEDETRTSNDSCGTGLISKPWLDASTKASANLQQTSGSQGQGSQVRVRTFKDADSSSSVCNRLMVNYVQNFVLRGAPELTDYRKTILPKCNFDRVVVQPYTGSYRFHAGIHHVYRLSICGNIAQPTSF